VIFERCIQTSPLRAFGAVYFHAFSHLFFQFVYFIVIAFSQNSVLGKIMCYNLNQILLLCKKCSMSLACGIKMVGDKVIFRCTLNI